MSHPVLMDKYIYGTECEVDAICDGTDYLVPGIMEQIERTGVHSGDSICVYPPYDFPQDVIDTLVDYTGRFARELHVTGLVNVQYAVSNGKVYVIEVNLRSSRTVRISPRSPASRWSIWPSAAASARSSPIWLRHRSAPQRPLCGRQGACLQLREAPRRRYPVRP